MNQNNKIDVDLYIKQLQATRRSLELRIQRREKEVESWIISLRKYNRLKEINICYKYKQFVKDLNQRNSRIYYKSLGSLKDNQFSTKDSSKVIKALELALKAYSNELKRFNKEYTAEYIRVVKEINKRMILK